MSIAPGSKVVVACFVPEAEIPEGVVCPREFTAEGPLSMPGSTSDSEVYLRDVGSGRWLRVMEEGLVQFRLIATVEESVGESGGVRRLSWYALGA